MARTAARLPDGARITDYISLGVEPVKRLHDETVAPIASKSTRGATCRWVVSGQDISIRERPA